MTTFREKENRCRLSFANGGPYWHLYTAGRDTPLIFTSPDEFAFAMNVIAQTTIEHNGLRIITFEIMGNHIHILAEGPRAILLNAFTFMRKRLSRGLKETHPGGLPGNFRPELKAITELEALRNTIAYINRNEFVADSNHTPYSYPWGAGRYFFGAGAQATSRFRDSTTLQRRRMFRGRVPKIPEEWPVGNGYILPPAYCLIDFGKAMFRDAHHYFALLSRNIEAYAELAVELDDGEFLNDAELFARLKSILQSDYSGAAIHDLTGLQKYDLARRLRRDFRSSNGQIRQLLALTRHEVDTLFPQSSKV